MTTTSQTAFIALAARHGVIADLADDALPTRVRAWRGQDLALPDEGTHFVYCAAGSAALECELGGFPLAEGMYAALPAHGRIVCGGAGRGLVITRLEFRGAFLVGGPVEERGRLRYIDGCTDSLLIPPVVLGDPCLNLLHIPPGTHQTQHVHPSIRVGTILSGTGTCETPGGKIALEPGLDFVIRAGGRHSFHTAGEALRVLAWHPDSDCGPSHEDHPMLNRTWIDASGARVR
ncbi:MAG: cupin domain-containing protein [Planctomycetota bacterium]